MSCWWKLPVVLQGPKQRLESLWGSVPLVETSHKRSRLGGTSWSGDSNECWLRAQYTVSSFCKTIPLPTIVWHCLLLWTDGLLLSSLVWISLLNLRFFIFDIFKEVWNQHSLRMLVCRGFRSLRARLGPKIPFVLQHDFHGTLEVAGLTAHAAFATQIPSPLHSPRCAAGWRCCWPGWLAPRVNRALAVWLVKGWKAMDVQPTLFDHIWPRST